MASVQEGEVLLARAVSTEKKRHASWRGVKKDWTWCHLSVFVLTFNSYALLHACRKAFSNVKSRLESEWTPFGDCRASNHSLFCYIEPKEVWTSADFFSTSKHAELFLAELDTIFLFMYAVGLYFSGAIGDRFPLRIVLSTGMCSSALAVFFFGTVTRWVSLYSIGFYIVIWAINGLLQSAAWPSVVAIMGNWFGKDGRGFIFGAWSACASVGNIIGAILVSAVLDFGYEYTFLVPSVCLFAGGIINIFCLAVHPSEVGIVAPKEEKSRAPSKVEVSTNLDQSVGEEVFDRKPTQDFPEEEHFASPTAQPTKKAINFFRAWLLPGVLVYSLSYAFLKLVNYALFFWLPYYLSKGLQWDEHKADELSTLYDAGGIIGGIVGGIISDWMGVRSPVVVAMLVIAAPSLFIYKRFGVTYGLNAFLMIVAGFFINGPANIESSAISADLGKQPALHGNTEAVSTVTGIVDGSGSIGAAIGQYLVGLIDTKTNWKNVFYFLMAMLLSSALCISELCYRDVKQLWRSWRLKRQGWETTHNVEDTSISASPSLSS